MAASLGSLVVSLGLDAAQFTTGLTKSEAEARKFARTIDNAIATGATVAGAALVVMGGAAVAAFAAINNLARQAGNFQDIGEKIGTNAENVAGFAVALNVAGKSAEDLGDFSVKLSKNLAGVSDGTDKAGAALIALGLDIKTFKALDPAEQIDALSKALATFSNQGGGKAAALEAIAKGGANLLPFLKELNEEGGRQVILTQAQILEADRYADAQARAKEQLRLYAEAIAIKTLPAITALTGAAKEFLKELVNMDSKSTDLANNNSIETWADKGAKALAFLVDAADGVGRAFVIAGKGIAAGAAQIAAVAMGEFARAKQIGKEFFADADEQLNRPMFSQKLAERMAARGNGNNAFFFNKTTTRPQLKFEGVTQDTGKSVLDGQLRALEAAIQREKDALAARAAFLQDTFRDGFLSVANYYGQLQQARNTELAHVLAFYDQEIAATQAFAAKSKDANAREQARTKVADIQEKQNKLVRDARTAEEQLARDRTRAAQEYEDQLDEINAKLLEIAGNTQAAASIRFDAQNRVLVNRLNASGDQAGVDAVQKIKDQQNAVLGLAEAQRVYSNRVDEVGIALSRIDLLQQTGSATEIDAINKKADLARQYVPILQAQVDLYEKQAQLLAAGPVKDAALLQIQKLRLEIDQLSAATDVLAKKFNDIFAGAIADGITALVSGTKSLKDVLNDVAKSITNQITQIASKQIGDSLFGKEGPLGGIGRLFGDAFGSTTKAAEGATLATAGSTLTLAGTGLTSAAAALSAEGATLAAAGSTLTVAGTGLSSAALTLDTSFVSAAATLTGAGTGLVAAAASLEGAAIALGASSAAKGAAGGLESILSLFGDFPASAGGGRPRVGQFNIVGEKGPELFVPDSSGTIFPTSSLAGDRAPVASNVFHINVMPGANRASADQAAAAVGRAVQRAQSRIQ